MQLVKVIDERLSAELQKPDREQDFKIIYQLKEAKEVAIILEELIPPGLLELPEDIDGNAVHTDPYPIFNRESESVWDGIKFKMYPINDDHVSYMICHTSVMMTPEILKRVFKDMHANFRNVGDAEILGTYVFKYEYSYLTNLATHCEQAYKIIYKSLFNEEPPTIN